MKIIVVGKGGREHALVQALKDSPSNPELYAWPGSEGMGDLVTRVDVPGLDELISYIKDEKIDLVVAGEEAWLAKGLADHCRAADIPCWGPMKEPAQLESSKIYAKNFMTKHGIPTGDFHVVSSLEAAKEKIDGYPTVLKYNGLAAGKGVAVCFAEAQADEFLDMVFTQEKFGKDDVFIEEFLDGKEVSVICAVADRDFVVFTPARDYKRLKNNDEGPNTGGMGAVASRNLLSPELLMDIENDIIGPTVHGLADDGIEYRGFLYFGIILTEKGPQVLEYNCRFGDPEAQAVLPIVGGEFAGFLHKGAEGQLDSSVLEFDDGWSMCLVKASRDYPQSSGSGDVITGLDAVEKARVYHAGTQLNADGAYETNGGRVLAVAAKGKTRKEAVENVYREAEKVQFDGAVIRTDIGTMHFED
jgi:phosphoribosylamine--glycine ligase